MTKEQLITTEQLKQTLAELLQDAYNRQWISDNPTKAKEIRRFAEEYFGIVLK